MKAGGALFKSARRTANDERKEMRIKFKATIEHDIPVPDVSSRKWPFATMNPGDSFLVPNEYRSAAQSAMSWFGKRNNMKFCSRKIDDKSFRIWRIA